MVGAGALREALADPAVETVLAVGRRSCGVTHPKIRELLWARALLARNPTFSFCYCSAAGAGGRSMWARVRRRVETALQAMPFRHAGCVRPAFIKPGPGIHSRVKLYEAFIAVMTPVFPLLV